MKQFLIYHLSFLIALACALCACSDEEGGSVAVTTDTYTVAVVAPLSSDAGGRWKSTVSWALSNIEKAQQSCSHRVKLNVEYYDEETEDISTLASDLGSREEVKAVIGPIDQDRLDIMAATIKGKDKPLMAINAGSTEVVRKYVEKKDFFWALTQTDISQCEVMLATAAQTGNTHFTLLCSDEGTMPQTFKDWFAFQATELGLTVTNTLLYNNASDLPDLLRQSLEGGHGGEETLVCVPRDATDARTMLELLKTLMAELPADQQPLIYFSNNVQQADLTDLSLPYNFYTVTPSADPQSGFYTAYYAHTGQTIESFEPQLYDALMLTALGLSYNPDDLKQSLIDITSGEGDELRAWSSEGMSQAFQGTCATTGSTSSSSGGLGGLHLTGASGNLQMDVDNHTCVTASHFMLSCYYEGMYIPLSYYSARSAGQSTSTSIADWKWQVTNVPDIETTTKTFSYPALDKQWAVVVAASSGFQNYRHQADVLNIYQYLKTLGFSDDHILLVMADDIASSPYNTHPGIISIEADGENLYHDISIDYHLADLTANDILDKIAALPSDADDNVFIFWSGHGSPQGLTWRDDETITPAMARSLMERMQGRYRKLLWCIEACYSGVIGEGIEGTPGVLVMTAANSSETSKSATYNSEMGIWMTNRFSVYLIETLKEGIAPDKGDITIREMYYYLSTHTLGSHVSLYNAQNYDDITTAGFREFLR